MSWKGCMIKHLIHGSSHRGSSRILNFLDNLFCPVVDGVWRHIRLGLSLLSFLPWVNIVPLERSPNHKTINTWCCVPHFEPRRNNFLCKEEPSIRGSSEAVVDNEKNISFDTIIICSWGASQEFSAFCKIDFITFNVSGTHICCKGNGYHNWKTY